MTVSLKSATLDPDIFGCPSRNYSYSRNTAKRTLNFLKGRPRSILKDRWPPIQFNVTMELNENQFARWQSFWRDSTGSGAHPFSMRLRTDLLEPYVEGLEFYEVRATGPWKADYDADRIWTVSLTVETKDRSLFSADLCDVIYGGSIQNLSTNDVWGGEIDSLASDIIAPCPYVEPQVNA